MFQKRFRLVAGMVVVVAVVLAAGAQPVMAEPPEPMVRTFGFMAGSSPDAVPDFLSDDSRIVRVTREEAAGDLEFIDSALWPDHPGQPEFMEGSRWLRQDAQHIETGGPREGGAFFWLLTDDTPEPPPAGAVTLTGPDGWIIWSDVYLINICENGGCNDDPELDGKWFIDGTAGDYFVVVTAVFTK